MTQKIKLQTEDRRTIDDLDTEVRVALKMMDNNLDSYRLEQAITEGVKAMKCVQEIVFMLNTILAHTQKQKAEQPTLDV